MAFRETVQVGFEAEMSNQMFSIPGKHRRPRRRDYERFPAVPIAR